MNPLKKALDEIFFRIPKPILHETYREKSRWFQNSPVDIQEHIREKVIRARVMVDCNLTGGTETYIALDGLVPETADDFRSIYRIPKSRTQGRTIVSALSINYATKSMADAYAQAQNTRVCSQTPEMQAAQAVYQSYAPIPLISGSSLSIEGENIIMVSGSNRLVANGYLRCVLANDDEFSNLQPRSVPHFCNLCVLAVKSYIYNELPIQIDQAKLAGGMELGTFKEIVDSYSDAEEQYQEYLHNTFAAVQEMNDEVSMRRMIVLMVGAMH